MSDVKLFVCCHQPAEVPRHPLLVPIQVGAALAESHFSGFEQDDTADNISSKNRSYCELTAQYWAWKNVDADYYGFFHYRRYLYPDINAKQPYRIEGKPKLSLLNRLNYDNFSSLIQQYDLILPIGEDMHLPAGEHYAQAPFHHRGDLTLAEKIVREISPEYVPALRQYLSGTVCLFGNIFIMKKFLFQDYCSWLFAILAEFERRANTSGYDSQEQRVEGYLAERLLGAYWMHHLQMKVAELPRVHFICDRRERWTKKLLYSLFPPGSRRRYLVKKIKM